MQGNRLIMTVHRALHLPELQVNVFGTLSSKDLLAAALAWKVWSAVALQIKWELHPVSASWLLLQLAPARELRIGNRWSSVSRKESLLDLI